MEFIKTQKGSLTVFLCGVLPVLLIILCFLVNVVVLVDNRIWMQAAVDRGVFAGASYLSEAMNKVAALNWRFRREYLDLKKKFDADSNEKVEWIEEQVKKVKKNQQEVIYDEGMMPLIGEAYARAHEIAREVSLKNLEGISSIVEPEYGSLYGAPGVNIFEMQNDCEGDYCKNIDELTPYEINGPMYDPTKYTPHPKILHTYLIKSDDLVALAGALSARFRSPLLNRFFDGMNGGHAIAVLSAAQPYGGSIKEFAHVEAESVSEAVEKGKGFFYRPRLIPVQTIRSDINVLH